jgi:NAD(P)-dependent dehydrogenase (short-subunit alcohol dehydrogenase family)
LAASGATVLVHGRDDARGRSTVAALRADSDNDAVHWLRADLASLAQVRALADRVIASGRRLDVLVNNAGIGIVVPGEGRRVESEDGLELRFAVNYLAGYLLTRRLLGLIKNSAPARIVNVSSRGQEAIEFDDVMLERDYDGMRAYRRSKLAQVMFTLDLAEELAVSGVTANCLHPATYMPTKMTRSTGAAPITPLEDGIQATYRLIADPELDAVSGRYFDGMRVGEPDPQAYDLLARRNLRELSDELCALARCGDRRRAPLPRSE